MYIFLALVITEEVFFFVYHYYRKHRDITFVHKNFGSSTHQQLSIDDLNFISIQARLAHFKIDDITWNDLQLDELYQQVSTCQSRCGDIILYRMFRNPLNNVKDIEKRQAFMEWFIHHPQERNNIQSALYDVSRSASPLTFEKQRFDSIASFLVHSLSLIMFISLIATLFNPSLFGLLIIIALINGTLSHYLTKSLSKQYENIQLSIRVMKGIQSVSRHAHKELNEWVDLDQCNHSLKGRIALFFDDFHHPDGFILLILSQLFLLEAITYYHFIRNSVKDPQDLLKAHDILGEIDAMIALSSYKLSLNTYCNPIFTNEPIIEAIEMVHPLLKNPVANDIHLRRNLLISGSNASGKSTFLKMVAINALFAQSFGFAFAKHYEAGFFTIMTSMSLRDSIEHKDSYFMSEIKSIKRILDACNDQEPILCMIDEILRGTNTNERIAASSEILYHLAQKKVLFISATHDIELTSILQNHLDNAHFNEQLNKGVMIFDYLLKEGPSNSSNAIKLLSLLGYGDDLVQRADQRLKLFIEQKRWIKEVE